MFLPFRTFILLPRTWYLGSFFCMVTNFMSYYTVATSVFSLMAMSTERYLLIHILLQKLCVLRYLVVTKPLNGRIRRSSALLGVVAITLLSLVLCLPPMVFSTTRTLRYPSFKDISSLSSWINLDLELKFAFSSGQMEIQMNLFLIKCKNLHFGSLKGFYVLDTV